MNDGEVSRPDVEDEWTPEYEDLYYRCVVVHPLGVPLESYKSTTELLEALRDAVKALRSLYFDANILHRDVSPGNIIISTEKRELDKPPTGLLIDLDMSLDLGETPAPGTLIGSQGYMAIGILGGDEHTYRHDLESLFYVFLWVAVCHDGQILGDAPSQSRLKQWLGNDWYTIWKTKEKDMQPENFLIWTNEEFAESFRCLLPLAIALHGLLFPLRDRLPFTGTDIKPNTIKKLYSDIIATFDKYLLLL
jgi:serine/threonine protein kinase